MQIVMKYNPDAE